MSFIGIGVAAFTMYKKKNIMTLFSLFLFSMFITGSAEYFVLTVFDGYQYKAGLFTDPFADSLTGHFIGNMALWGGTGILVGAFSLGYRWIFMLSILLMLTEGLFVRLGIYEHHWWRFYMTGFAAFIYYNFIKVWFSKLYGKQHKLLRYITLYFVSFCIIHFSSVLALLLGKKYFSIGWNENLYRDSSQFAFIYHAGMSFINIFFVCTLQKWFWKFTPITIFLLSDTILLNMNILIFKNGWNLLYLTLTRIASLIIFILLEKYSIKQAPL